MCKLNDWIVKHKFVVTICHIDLPHVTHVDTYVIDEDSYMKSNATFGLGDNSRKVRI